MLRLGRKGELDVRARVCGDGDDRRHAPLPFGRAAGRDGDSGDVGVTGVTGEPGMAGVAGEVDDADETPTCPPPPPSVVLSESEAYVEGTRPGVAGITPILTLSVPAGATQMGEALANSSRGSV